MIVRKIGIKLFNRPISVWYFKEKDFINFGDELTPDIITRLFNRDVKRVDIEEADLFCVGSILEIAENKRNKTAYVWGSGYIQEGDKAKDSMGLTYRAVRGFLSRDRLPVRFGSIPVGDPGLLSNLIYNKKEKKSGKIGIVAHYVDEDSPYLDRAREMPEIYSIISVKSPPEQVALQITECRLILSSSLHGLIMSDSFGIPNIHTVFSDKVAGSGYKFKDYYSAIGKEYTTLNKSDLYDTKKLSLIEKLYTPIDNLQEIQTQLIQSFPFK